MAEFCEQCSRRLFGAPSDFKGEARPGEVVQVLCESCGWIWVDHQGKRVDPPEATMAKTD
jgi:RNase P subunit RPR2